MTTAEELWDARYAESKRIWSGAPNAALVVEVAGLEPGRALDLGSGEGGDAIWLAQQGWRVTGVDVSPVALGRAAEHAKEAGVDGLIEWQHHELGKTFPEGTFELVSAQFLHSTIELPREEILRQAADAVTVGGVLLIEGHLEFPDKSQHQAHADVHFPTPAEVVADLGLKDGRWEVLTEAAHDSVKVIDGKELHYQDGTVKARRLS
ncbi:class I SAM-dependent methyltransferase [Kribbella antibiotica]|uniref:Class I SAM-dependent methyltransferase n=1 Tax=Kribbella antibiotica TaxID=190195 RepID=A0A4R4ZW05_9ACTN|nr:class I SAM-dependent methyltransferase [Kribbella antibiotica]TDD62720.1 class I SAM-dependent methyltransferase [Kribbella antibiotica]